MIYIVLLTRNICFMQNIHTYHNLFIYRQWCKPSYFMYLLNLFSRKGQSYFL